MNTSSIGRVTAQLLRVWRLLTPVEWLTIAIGCGVLAALFSPDSWTVARRKIERRAREWAPSESDRKQPSASLMAPDFDIAGQWAVRRHLNSSSMTIVRTAPGEYSVAFSTAGCMGFCKFQRTARLQRGVITLDAAVAEYMPFAYDTLYAVRANGEELLLPAAFVDEFEAEFEHRQGELDQMMKFYVFRRLEEFPEEP